MIWICILVVIIVIFSLSTFSVLLKLRNQLKQLGEKIYDCFNQKFNLVPSLVECVKAYSENGNEELEDLIKIESEYKQFKGKDLEQLKVLNIELDKTMSMLEKSSEIKESEKYINLQKKFEEVETQFKDSKEIYNVEATKYNTKIESMPINLVANMFGFKKATLL